MRLRCLECEGHQFIKVPLLELSATGINPNGQPTAFESVPVEEKIVCAVCNRPFLLSDYNKPNFTLVLVENEIDKMKVIFSLFNELNQDIFSILKNKKEAHWLSSTLGSSAEWATYRDLQDVFEIRQPSIFCTKLLSTEFYKPVKDYFLCLTHKELDQMDMTDFRIKSIFSDKFNVLTQ